MGLHEAQRRAVDHAASWLGSVAERPVGVPVDAESLRARLGTLPDEGVDPAIVIDELATALEPGLVATPGPRYFGFVTGGTLPAALAAEWLVTAFDQNAASYVMSPASAVAEEVAGSWLLELLGLPAGAAVGFVTGAQMANVSCLAAARHAVLARRGWDVEAAGLASAPVPAVLIGEKAHSTLLQSLRLLGLGAGTARRVPADGQGRMRPDALRAAMASTDGPVLVCAQAGEVDTGAVDPLDAIADLVEERPGSWLHVDGAFGLWVAASPTRRALLAGRARADSWAIDAHKWLNVAYDCGMAIVHDPEASRAALATTAPYLALGARDPSASTPESSRRARAVPVYAALRSLGRHGVGELVDRCCDLATQAAAELAASPRVEVLNEVVLNQVLFRAPGVDTAALLDRVRRDGTCWVGGTTWHDSAAVRFSVSNWSTTAADITRSTTAIIAATAQLTAG